MKKTLIAVLAILLIVALSFSMFACNKNETPTDNTQTDKSKDKDKNKDKDKDKGQQQGTALTDETLGDYEAPTTLMVVYADQYITNNATDTKDVSSAMQTALTKEAAKLTGEPIKGVVVKLESDDCYSLSFTYANNDTYVYHKEAQLVARTAEKGVPAGYPVADGATKADFDKSLAQVYNAFLHTIKAAIEDGTAFGDDYKLAATGEDSEGLTFGGSVEAAFTLNYGVGEGQIGPMSYGLKVYGTLAYAAEDTQVAIEVIDEQNEGKVLVGLYYKDTTLYLSLNFGDYEQKVYLDNADINAIVGGILGDVFSEACDHDYADGYCTKCGKVEPADAEADAKAPFYEHADYSSFKTAINDLVNNSTVGLVVGIVGGLTTSTQTAISGGTRYQYSIDVGALIDRLLGNSTLGPIIADTVNPIITNVEFLSQLDLASFKGIGGVLTLAFDVTSAKTLAGAQISYNVAQKDFRWNKNDAEAKIYGPVNGAITIKDFAIGEQDVTVNADDYNYFSPMNGEINADITLTGYSDASLNGKYNLAARAVFNPFTLFAGADERDGEAEIVLTRENGDNFLHVYVHDFTYVDEQWDATVTVQYLADAAATYYETKVSESDFFSKIFFEFVLPLVERDSNSVLAPISDYVWELVDQFSKTYTYAEFTAFVADAKAEVNALVVTAKDAEGNVFASSKWLDGIKSTALDDIDFAIEDITAESEEDELKAAKITVEAIVSQAKSDYAKQLSLEGKTDSIFDGLDIMALVSNIGALKDLFIGDEGAANPDVFDYDLSDLFSPKLHLDLDADVYNDVIEILKNALPKLTEFDDDAAKIKVDMNYDAATQGAIHVNVVYGGYEVDVFASIKDCFVDGKLASTCKATADVTIKTPDGNYVYAASIALNNWDKNNGTITVSFKESDGRNASRAEDEFVNVVITQKWDGEKYQGFDAVATLRSRKADHSGMNEAHVYNVHGFVDADGFYCLTIDECGITLGFGEFAVAADFDNTLSFGIPAPSCSASFKVAMGSEDVRVDIENLKLVKWGTDDVVIEGIDTEGKELIVNEDIDNQAADEALYEIFEESFLSFFYRLK